MPFGTVRPLCVWAAFFILGAPPLAAADLDQYREFRLGSSTAAVLKLARSASPADVTRDAHARGLAHLRILAEEAREASEKTRSVNKATFTP